MAINTSKYFNILEELKPKHVKLIAVSKLQPTNAIRNFYKLGQRDFAENYVQELVEKHENLKNLEINWHFIGHLQSNKVKYIAPFVNIIHSVDSLKLLKEINKEAKKNDRVIDCLLQVYIAKEETKYGLSNDELVEILDYQKANHLENVKIIGLMGMASFVDDESVIRNEFRYLKSLENLSASFNEFSFGMSQDYKLAVEEGSTMIRIGSLIFGSRS